VAARTDALLPAFAGFFFALALSAGSRDTGLSAGWLARAPDPLAGVRSLERGRVLDPDSMCVRDLRRLPAIGPARALAIVRARYEHGLRGGPYAWDRIPGIGPETVHAARAWLAARRAARLSGGEQGAYTSPGRRP
jgi:hypothetical protein